MCILCILFLCLNHGTVYKTTVAVTLPNVSFVFFVRILRPNCPLLKTLGDMMPYETAVGINGRIWVKGRSTVETITIANIISNSEHCSDGDMKTFVKSRVHALSGLH